MYSVLAFYHFTEIADPEKEVLLHKQFFSTRDVTCRIYINEQGINGQMSALKIHADEYIDWMHQRPEFKDVYFKTHEWHEQAFPRVTVKYRKHLVAYDEQVDLSQCGEHLAPKEWKEMLETEDNKILVDVRNDYEWKLGRFEGADLPPCETFRQFDRYAEELKEKVDPKTTPVMMYCTGGIRCELYSSVLRNRGFEKVYQLDGGVINYGLKEGNAHWLGKLFVFDDRLSVPICDKDAPVIGKCLHCQKPSETYYNCANIDCNELFLSCPECSAAFKGCCNAKCCKAERVRPYHENEAHKPFKRWYNYVNNKTQVV